MKLNLVLLLLICSLSFQNVLSQDLDFTCLTFEGFTVGDLAIGVQVSDPAGSGIDVLPLPSTFRSRIRTNDPTFGSNSNFLFQEEGLTRFFFTTTDPIFHVSFLVRGKGGNQDQLTINTDLVYSGSMVNDPVETDLQVQLPDGFLAEVTEIFTGSNQPVRSIEIWSNETITSIALGGQEMDIDDVCYGLPFPTTSPPTTSSPTTPPPTTPPPTTRPPTTLSPTTPPPTTLPPTGAPTTMPPTTRPPTTRPPTTRPPTTRPPTTRPPLPLPDVPDLACGYGEGCNCVKDRAAAHAIAHAVAECSNRCRWYLYNQCAPEDEILADEDRSECELEVWQMCSNLCPNGADSFVVRAHCQCQCDFFGCAPFEDGVGLDNGFGK